MRHLLRSADFQAGLMFAALAALGWWLSSELRLGSAMRMGPGYLPTMISFILFGLGLGTMALAVLNPGPATGAWALRPLAAIVAALLVFSFGVDQLGLFLTIVVLVVVASLASTESRWIEVILAALALAAFSTLLFVTALGLAIPAWPQLTVF